MPSIPSAELGACSVHALVVETAINLRASIVFAEHVKIEVDQQTRSIMTVVEQQTGHLESMLHQMPQHFSLAPTDNIRALHNRYVKAILASTAAKHVSLSLSLIESVNNADFLTYAMAARSAVEVVATLRYLLLTKMAPVIHTMAQSRTYDASQVNELIKYENTYLRGTRFDWVKFFETDLGLLMSAMLSG